MLHSNTISKISDKSIFFPFLNGIDLKQLRRTNLEFKHLTNYFFAHENIFHLQNYLTLLEIKKSELEKPYNRKLQLYLLGLLSSGIILIPASTTLHSFDSSTNILRNKWETLPAIYNETTCVAFASSYSENLCTLYTDCHSTDCDSFFNSTYPESGLCENIYDEYKKNYCNILYPMATLGVGIAPIFLFLFLLLMIKIYREHKKNSTMRVMPIDTQQSIYELDSLLTFKKEEKNIFLNRSLSQQIKKLKLNFFKQPGSLRKYPSPPLDEVKHGYSDRILEITNIDEEREEKELNLSLIKNQF